MPTQKHACTRCMPTQKQTYADTATHVNELYTRTETYLCRHRNTRARVYDDTETHVHEVYADTETHVHEAYADTETNVREVYVDTETHTSSSTELLAKTNAHSPFSEIS